MPRFPTELSPPPADHGKQFRAWHAFCHSLIAQENFLDAVKTYEESPLNTLSELQYKLSSKLRVNHAMEYLLASRAVEIMS